MVSDQRDVILGAGDNGRIDHGRRGIDFRIVPAFHTGMLGRSLIHVAAVRGCGWRITVRNMLKNQVEGWARNVGGGQMDILMNSELSLVSIEERQTEKCTQSLA